ncbi:MAG: T9SS type A sorting domain-containing protein [Chitinophagales bacterium]
MKTCMFSFFTKIPLCCLLLCLHFITKADNTANRVYNIFQTNCTTSGCHNNNEKAGNLDLQGSGQTPMSDVGLSLYKGTPTNMVSQAENDFLIYPGQPYRSNIFNYIASEENANIELHPLEDPNDLHKNLDISPLDQEIIRQWILTGARTIPSIQAPDVDVALLEAFYNGQGAWSIDPLNPPAKPELDKGFQIRIGPMFLPASDIVSGNLTDVVYDIKHDFLNNDVLEINQISAYIGASHHFVGQTFIDNSLAESQTTHGFLQQQPHNNKETFTTFTQTGNYALPTGAAIFWNEETILNFQMHATNYSENLILAYDVYLNIYTQQNGTASQELQFGNYWHSDINIPPNSDAHKEVKATYTTESEQIYVWSISSHTHLRGLDYNIWLRNVDGTKGEQIYAASNYNGVPNCEFIGYNYETPPLRTFDFPFLNIDMKNGIIEEASYFNNTDQAIVHGSSSTENEMMLISVAYITDTIGVSFDEGSVCYSDEINGISTNEKIDKLSLSIFPNPIRQNAQINIASHFIGNLTGTLYDLNGKIIRQEKHFIPSNNEVHSFAFEKENLKGGMYLYEIRDPKGNRKVERLIIGQ